MTAKRALAAIVAAAVVLIAVEVAVGAFGKGTPEIKSACAGREPFSGGGIDGTIQRVVLDGLDGAACQLKTSREELVLSLDPNGVYGRKWDRKTVEDAIRAGMLRSLDEADRRGDIPGFLAGILRQAVERAPIDKLLNGGFNLGDLIG